MVVDACDFSSVPSAMVIQGGAGHCGGSIYIVPWCPARLPPSQLPSSPVKSDESTSKISGRLGKAAGRALSQNDWLKTTRKIIPSP